MSTNIKIGDTVLRVGATVGSCVHGTEYRVTDAHPGELKIAGPPGWWSVSKFELVRIPDAPAPLDPSKVKAGDTVTLERPSTSIVPATYSRTFEGAVESVVEHTDGSIGFNIAQMTFYLGEHWTLTAHQPAPEPEPEWLAGTTGTATLNDLVSGLGALDMRVMRVEWDGLHGFATQTGRIVEDGSTTWSISDFVPDAPAPTVHVHDLANVAHDVLAGPRYECSHAAMHVAEAVEVYLSGHGYSPAATVTREQVAAAIQGTHRTSVREFLITHGVPVENIRIDPKVYCVLPSDAANDVMALLGGESR